MDGADQIDVQNQIGQMRTHQMMIEDISSKLQSKTDWYKYLEQNL